MNDLLNDPKLHSVGMVILMGIAGFFGRRELKRLDESIKDSVKRQEFDQLRKDMDTRHQENIGRLDQIGETAIQTHRRIDDLYRDLIVKKGS